MPESQFGVFLIWFHIPGQVQSRHCNVYCFLNLEIPRIIYKRRVHYILPFIGQINYLLSGREIHLR